ncbi:hypothetical protein PC116_g3587 [Phytophthora cactorum]|uniref:Uncharacterized protein n=1 Tax=Phytophthora cactorum TaxID=29920 RepID=A0A8T1LGA9_9STRA|nr:hypothetical protein PC114_g1955 [Phytophthora cactorum]KAG2953746.1 hypothetical protein PC117_g1715 [Phytophthora cactorum]KAG3038663.1 hypothetical protein PC119_g2708 [Phytophthora cactorum]KAG3191068.1 hypothetical protein C6341_g1347 [Phytophthora cactorum]KAG4248634.1 hypothetical protein PC116_g3587 [Phytophthora cactorum]
MNTLWGSREEDSGVARRRVRYAFARVYENKGVFLVSALIAVAISNGESTSHLV